MKPHPAAEAFPDMTAHEFAELKADIKAHGLHAPVELFDGQIIDGRHRFRACKELRQVPDLITLDSHDIGGDPFAYVVSVNLHRRHLSASQRGMIAVQIKRAMEADAADRMKAGTLVQNCTRGTSAEHAAKAVGVSTRTVATATKVADNGAKPVVEAVKAGKLSVAKAEKIVKATPDKREQTKLLKKSLEDDSFDPATMAPVAEKKIKPGKPVVSVKERKACLALHGQLCRALHRVGIYDEFIQPLSQIAERLEQI